MIQVRLSDFLTDKEIKHAIWIYEQMCRSLGTDSLISCAALVTEEIITPNLSRINEALGQENDARFLGYLVEYALMKADEAHKGRNQKRA